MSTHIPFALRAAVVGALALAVAVVASGDAASAQGPAGAWTTFANGDDVLALAVDDDVLWAGTRSGGLVRWQGEGNVQYLRPQDPIAGNTVRDVAIGPDGRVWLATEFGLSVLDDADTPDRGDDRWYTYTKDSTFGALPSDDVRTVAIAGETVWIGTFQTHDFATGEWSGGGLAHLDTKGTWDPEDDDFAPVATFANTYTDSPTGDDKLGLVSDNITDLVVTDEGDLWVATQPHWMLQRVDLGEVTRTAWTRVHGGISHLKTYATFVAADDVWTANDCETKQETVTCIVHAMAIDSEGMVWAAIGGRGVMYFRASDPIIIDERSRRFTPPSEATGDFVHVIAFGPSDVPALANTVWMATSGSGVHVLDHNGSLRNKVDDIWNFDRGVSFTTEDGLARNRAQALARVGNTLWVGTGPAYGTAGGISPIDIDNLTIAAPLRTLQAPPTNFITDLAIGAPGTAWEDHVWVATGSRAQHRFGAGVAAIDTKGTRSPADDAWTRYDTRGTDADGRAPWSGMVGDNVHAIALLGDQVWVGSVETTWDRVRRAYTDGGLAVFTGGNWTARTVENTGGANAGLRSGNISSLAAGCDGELWIGTGSPRDGTGAGVDVLRTGASPHVLAQDVWVNHVYLNKSARDSLPSKNITDISVNCADERIWVSGAHHVRLPEGGSPGGGFTGGGVSAWDVGASAWTRYDVRHGLVTYSENEELLGEAMAVLAGPGDTAWAGTYGTDETDTAALVKDKPFWPAVLNAFDGTAWTHEVFEDSGFVSALARDPEGALWVGTSRFGIAFESDNPESWTTEPSVGGLFVEQGDVSSRLTMTNSGIPSNDISVVRIAEDGTVWIGTEGWGLARFIPGAEPPTPTPTGNRASPTPTATRVVPTPTQTEVEPTPTQIGGTARTPTPTRTTGGTGVRKIWLPFTTKARR